MYVRRKTGTREWAEINKNLVQGCKHDCKYCYARANALRFKRIGDKSEWSTMTLLKKNMDMPPKSFGGKRIMFPTTHDIFPEHIEETIQFLKGYLEKGNEILIVTKPHLECIERICDDLKEFKDQIVFRFTIGSMHDELLHFWEPEAPTFSERLNSLKHAHSKGFKTSVSCEPFLDEYIVELAEAVEPYVTDTIWIGKMNLIKLRVDTEGWSEEELGFIEQVENCQTDLYVKAIYDAITNIGGNLERKVRWKDSIKKVLELPEEEVG